MAISENSNAAGTPAVGGTNTAGGDGVFGTGRRGIVGVSDEFQGVFGKSRDNAGVVGESDKMHAVFGITHSTFAGVFGASDAGGAGVAGESKAGRGIHGVSETGDGVFGTGRRGVVGESQTFQGVFGKSRDNSGVVGESDKMHAVFGITHSTFAGVFGASDAGGVGVAGESKAAGRGVGVLGQGASEGVKGQSDFGMGVVAESNTNTALIATTRGTASALIVNQRGTGNIIIGRNVDNAEVFRVTVSGDVLAHDVVLSGGDCAEEFDIDDIETIEPGTVMVINETGALEKSQRAYDKKVAGVVSGAGGYTPGIVLDKQYSQPHRKPIALLGKVFCRVDAQYGAIEVGDLLTTSPTPGHAMKASHPLEAFGAVIGKALRPLAEGQRLIPILIALQ